MATNTGMTFTVGAKLQSTVGSVFSTLEGRIKTLKNIANVAGNLNAVKASLYVLKEQAKAEENVRNKIQRVSFAFASAQRVADKYTVSVKNSARVHALAITQIERTEAALKRQEIYQRNRAKRSELKGQIMGTIGSVMAVAAPAKVAMEFETAMADAAKTIEGMRDSAGKLTPEYYKMEATVKRMGRELPLTHHELASIFSIGGQLGLDKAEELEEFTRLTAHASVAFGVSTEQAAENIGGMRSQMNKSFTEIREIMDLMTQYANTSSATESSISNIVTQVGSLGETAGLSAKPLTAIAATLASMKVDDSRAATGLKNFLLTFTSGEAATKKRVKSLATLGIDAKELAKEMQRDAEGAILAVLKKIQGLEKYQQASILEQLFGRESIGAIAPLLTRLDLLKKNFELAGKTTNFAGAMQKEFSNRARTTANALIILKNKMAEVAINAGSALLPAINDIVGVFGVGAVKLAEFAEEHPKVIRGVMGAASALAAFKVAGLAVSYTMTVLSDAVTFMKGVFTISRLALQRSTYAMIYHSAVTKGLAAGTRILAVAQGMLNLVMANNPIGWVVKGTMLLGGVLYELYQHCQPVREALDSIWNGFLSAIEPVTSKVVWLWDKIKSIMSWVNGDESENAEDKANKELNEREKAEQKANLTEQVKQARIAPVMQPPMLLSEMSGATGTNTQPQATSSLPDIASLTGSFGGANVSIPQGNANTSIVQNLSLNITVEGVTDNDFGKRVIESIEERKTRLQKIFDDLLHDANRRAYS